jgi:hypothetical protein
MAPDHSPGAAKTVELPRRTQGSFTRCFCSPNPSASTSAASIQMHYEPFCSGIEDVGMPKDAVAPRPGERRAISPTASRIVTYRRSIGD